MKRHASRGLLLGAGLALAALAAGIGVAYAAPEPTIVQVSAEAPAADGNSYVVSARVATAAGRPVNGLPVRFYVMADLLGTQPMLIGTDTTDGQGLARVKYIPSWTGQHEVRVKFAGSSAFAPAEGKSAFNATFALHTHQPGHVTHENERLPLGGFSDRLPYAVGAIVLAVWLAIAYALVGTIGGVLSDRAPETARSLVAEEA